MARPAFIRLWSSYPAQDRPCAGGWGNPSASRLSITPNRARAIAGTRARYRENQKTREDCFAGSGGSRAADKPSDPGNGRRTRTHGSPANPIGQDMKSSPVYFALPAHAQPPADGTTQASFRGKTLVWQDDQGPCRLMTGELKRPCQFHRTPEGLLCAQRIGSADVLLVPLAPPRHDCNTTQQAIRARNQRLEARAVSRVTAHPSSGTRKFS